MTEDHSGDPPSEDSASNSARARLESEAERAIDSFDESLVDLLAWLLDTETRARIYIYLRTQPGSTSEEIAEGTGLYPSTVRESLAELHQEDVVTRRKRDSEGTGNNPYEYTAMAPSSLVTDAVSQLQDQLNAVCNLDRRLGNHSDSDSEPVRIEVKEASDEDST